MELIQKSTVEKTQSKLKLKCNWSKNQKETKSKRVKYHKRIENYYYGKQFCYYSEIRKVFLKMTINKNSNKTVEQKKPTHTF